MKVTIKVEDTPPAGSETLFGKEVELRDLTIICKQADVGDVSVDGAFILDPEQTVYHGKMVNRVHPEFWTFVKLIVDPWPDNLHTIQAMQAKGIAWHHVIGLVDLTLKLQDRGKLIQLRYPETYLHPAWQLGLGDFAIAISQRK